jgi:hypothetical protein
MNNIDFGVEPVDGPIAPHLRPGAAESAHQISIGGDITVQPMSPEVTNVVIGSAEDPLLYGIHSPVVPVRGSIGWSPFVSSDGIPSTLHRPENSDVYRPMVQRVSELELVVAEQAKELVALTGRLGVLSDLVASLASAIGEIRNAKP